MISSLSKYFYKSDEEFKSEENTESNEKQKISKIDTIKTNNFLRKLRKIDSTENILNFVQLTEYKKTPKSKSKSGKKGNIPIRSTLEEHKDETGNKIKKNDFRTSQKSQSELFEDPTKISRKNKGEDISIQIQHDDNNKISNESITIDGERIPSKYFDTFTTNSTIQVVPSENYKNERSEASILNKDTNFSRAMGPSAKGEGGINKDNDRKLSLIHDFELSKTASAQLVTGSILPSSTETNLDKTKSSQLLTTSFVDTSFDHVPQKNYIDAKNCNTVWNSKEMKVKEEVNKKSQSRIFLLGDFLKDFDVTKSSSRQSLPLYEHKVSPNEFASMNSLNDTISVEKLVKLINLQSEITETNLKETSVLFTRQARSNDSIKSRLFNFENSKIPIPCKADHGAHAQGKSIKLLDENERVSEEDSHKPSVEVVPSIEIDNENISTNSIIPTISPRNNQSVCSVTIDPMLTVPSITSIPHRLKCDESSTSIKISEKSDPKRRIDIKRSSKKIVSSKSCVQQIHKKPSRICSNIKSKMSIFNSGINTDKNKLLLNSKRKFNKNKETTSRIPLNSGTYSHKNKSFANIMVRRQQEDNIQSKYISHTSKRDLTRSFIKPESYDSQNTIKLKTATPKKIPVKVEKSLENEAQLPKEISIVNINSSIEDNSSSKTGQEEDAFFDEVNRCKELEKDILEKIEVYWKSIQNVCTIKNTLLPTLDIISFKNIMNQCFLNDKAVNMISKLNEVERMKLKEHSLSATNIYGQNETRKVKEELKKYHEYVKQKFSEVAVKKPESTETSHDMQIETSRVLESTKKEMELRNQEITETVLHALTFVSAEHEILTQYCQEIIKKNNECNGKLTEKLTWLERENGKLSTEIFNLKKQSVSSKTCIDDVELKKKNDQISEIRKMYNDIEMKNNYHAQLVENFMKSVKMIENKIEHYNKNLELKVERAKSQIDIAEMKRTALEDTIEKLKQKLEHNQREYNELMNKVDEFRKIVAKLRNKNKALSNELLKYKYPERLENNIQKMITLRNMLVNIVYKSDNGVLPLQDSQLLEIKKRLDHSNTIFPVLDSTACCAESIHQKTPTEMQTVCGTEFSTSFKDHGEPLGNVFLVGDSITDRSGNIDTL